MSDFTYEDFRAVIEEIADYISHKGGLALDNGWDCSQDFLWEKKRAYAAAVFYRFMRMFNIIGDGKRWEGGAKKLIEAIEHPNVAKLQGGGRPFFINDPKHQMNNPDHLKKIFDLFIGDYDPPNDIQELENHLWALHLYFSEVGPITHGIAPSIPQHIDFAFVLATGRSREKVVERRLHGVRYFDGKTKEAKTKETEKSKTKQRVIEIFYTIENRSALGPFKLARIIRERWSRLYPNEKCRGNQTIVNWLRDDDIIK